VMWLVKGAQVLCKQFWRYCNII